MPRDDTRNASMRIMRAMQDAGYWPDSCQLIETKTGDRWELHAVGRFVPWQAFIPRIGIVFCESFEGDGDGI